MLDYNRERVREGESLDREGPIVYFVQLAHRGRVKKKKKRRVDEYLLTQQVAHERQK